MPPMPSHLLAVLQVEIFIAPALVLVVRRHARMGVASLLHRGMERDRVGIVLRAARVEYRRQVGAAAEPRLGRHDEARVHVHRRHMRVLRMADQRNAGRPKPRIGVGAGDLLAEFGRELAENGRDVDADLFEYAAMHDRHHPAAAVRAAVIAAAPGRANETSRGTIRERRGGGQPGFHSLQCRADVVPQRFEPCARPRFARLEQIIAHRNLRSSI